MSPLDTSPSPYLPPAFPVSSLFGRTLHLFFFLLFVFCAGAIVRGLYRRPRYSALILAQHPNPRFPLSSVSFGSPSFARIV